MTIPLNVTNTALVCLKCGGRLDRIPDMDAVRCHKCKRLWDALELHKASISGSMELHGVGYVDLGPSDPDEFDDL